MAEKSKEATKKTGQKTDKKAENTAKKAVSEEKKEKPVKKADAEQPVAKAGRRSKKGLEETKEKIEKVEKQKADDSREIKPETKPKLKQKPPKSRLERRGKKYKDSAKKIESGKSYSFAEAAELVCETSTTKFDSSVELHVRLNVDPKQADQNIRDSVVLPAGTGKTAKIAVFGDDENVAKAKKAGADIAGGDDLLAKIEKEKIDFDILIASPALMPKLAKYAKILGPKGLMPNPKSGTVTNDVTTAVKQAKAGKIEYRVDGNGIIHTSIGKVSFGKDKLLENAVAIAASVKQNKPASVKSNYVNTVYLTTSMGPSIKVKTGEIA